MKSITMPKIDTTPITNAAKKVATASLMTAFNPSNWMPAVIGTLGVATVLTAANEIANGEVEVWEADGETFLIKDTSDAVNAVVIVGGLVTAGIATMIVADDFNRNMTKLQSLETTESTFDI